MIHASRKYQKKVRNKKKKLKIETTETKLHNQGERDQDGRDKMHLSSFDGKK